MKRRIAVGVVVAAVATPAAVVLAGNGPGAFGGAEQQSVQASKRQQAPKNWKPVPTLGNVSFGEGAMAVTVSAQMTKGKAKFRIIRPETGAIVAPGAVLFSARASNAFTWGFEHPCELGAAHQLQWKRAGKGKAVAAKMSRHDLYEAFCT